MSSAILYIAIVAIWAFVLIPRWLRRPHLLGGENAEPEGTTRDEADGSHSSHFDFRTGSQAHGREPAANDDAGVEQAGPEPAPISRSKVLQARRRLLTTLMTLAVVAAACTYLKLTSWWVCVPPAGMLGTYLLLLREAALADAEQGRWRAAEDRRVQAVRQRAHAEREERTAQVIDISARLGDQLYDQYADATMRAVGD